MKITISIKNLNAYLYLYGMFKKQIQNANIITIKEMHAIVKWYCRFPRGTQKKMIDDMVEMGLLKRIDRDHFEIISEIDVRAPHDGHGEPLW